MFVFASTPSITVPSLLNNLHSLQLTHLYLIAYMLPQACPGSHRAFFVPILYQPGHTLQLAAVDDDRPRGKPASGCRAHSAVDTGLDCFRSMGMMSLPMKAGK